MRSHPQFFPAGFSQSAWRLGLPLLLAGLMLTACGGSTTKGSTTPPPPEKVKADAKKAYDDCVKQAKEKQGGDKAVLDMCELVRQSMERHATPKKK
jgi:outer membrane PBP1 activator LpoA protein